MRFHMGLANVSPFTQFRPIPFPPPPNRLTFRTNSQLVILSFASFWGRLAAGFAVRPMGVGNLIVLSTFCCSAINLSMGGLASAGSVVVVAVLYGLFSGMCECNFLCF